MWLFTHLHALCLCASTILCDCVFSLQEEKNEPLGNPSGNEGAIAGRGEIMKESDESGDRVSGGHGMARVKNGVERVKNGVERVKDGGSGDVISQIHEIADEGAKMVAGPAEHVLGQDVVSGPPIGWNLEVQGGEAVGGIPANGSRDEGPVDRTSGDRASPKETHEIAKEEVHMDMSYAFKGGGESRQIGDGDYRFVEEDMIPADPLLAETHYSQYNDFESDDESEEEKVSGCG